MAKKTNHLSMRMPQEIYDILENRTQEVGMLIPEYIRMLIYLDREGDVIDSRTLIGKQSDIIMRKVDAASKQ